MAASIGGVAYGGCRVRVLMVMDFVCAECTAIEICVKISVVHFQSNIDRYVSTGLQRWNNRAIAQLWNGDSFGVFEFRDFESIKMQGLLRNFDFLL